MIAEHERIEMALADLRPAPYNPRTISEPAMRGLTASLERFGIVQPIVWNRRTGNVVIGHQRLRALQAAGVERTQVVVVELEPSDEKALNVASNSPHIAGEFTDGLEPLLAELHRDDAALFDALRFDALESWTNREPDPLANDNDAPAPEPPKDPVTRSGDLWTLGDHQLLCGDCRIAADVDRLVAGAPVNVAITSPPYASQRKYDESSGFKPIAPGDYVEWFEPVQANVARVLAPDGSFFLNIKEHCEAGQRVLYVKDLTLAHVRRWGWRFVDELCWRHQGLPGTWPDRFKNAWEPVFHFTRGKPIRFRPAAAGHASTEAFKYSDGADRPATATGNVGWRGGDVDTHTGRALPSNVLDVANSPAGRIGIRHSAAFPAALPQFFLRAFSDRGDVVFDPFGGSGTTIIAAEREGRRGLAVEISPAYCDVIVERWEQTTGGKARRG